MEATKTRMAGSKQRTAVGRKQKEPDESIYSGRVAARVRDLRIKSGKSGEEMAIALGIPYSTYATYENGKANWPYDLTPDFARILGISIRSVFPIE